jgi:hypothetical protein
MAYSVRVDDIAYDGTNNYFHISISDGFKTMAKVYPSFPAGTAVEDIDTFFQTIANNAPEIDLEIQKMVGKVYIQQ